MNVYMRNIHPSNVKIPNTEYFVKCGISSSLDFSVDVHGFSRVLSGFVVAATVSAGYIWNAGVPNVCAGCIARAFPMC